MAHAGVGMDENSLIWTTSKVRDRTGGVNTTVCLVLPGVRGRPQLFAFSNPLIDRVGGMFTSREVKRAEEQSKRQMLLHLQRRQA